MDQLMRKIVVIMEGGEKREARGRDSKGGGGFHGRLDLDGT
jgi:hypothetical protein